MSKYLEYIVETFRNDSRFINDFEGINEYLSKLDISIEEKNEILDEILGYNSSIYSMINEENKNLKKIVENIKKSSKNNPIPKIDDNIEKTSKEIEPLDIDISFYKYQIQNCEDLESLEEILPDITDENLSLIYAIITWLLEEIYEYKKLIYIERDNINEETKKLFKNEIDKLNYKICFIKNKIELSKTETVVTPKNNELFFLKTHYGNVCAISDLKDIMDYKDQFYELLESIRLGTFKNVKTFSSTNDTVKWLSEVKGDGTRIIFDRIGKNKYVIIYMFIKRVDKSAGYIAALQNRNDLYKSNREKIRALSNNPEFINENEDIRIQIYNKLRPDNKVKKIGELNE